MLCWFACTSAGRSPPETATLQNRSREPARRFSDMMEVVHVISPSGCRAGAPARGPIIMSIKDLGDDAVPFAVVDGVPMGWTGASHQKEADTHRAPLSESQFGFLSGGSAMSHGNRIDLGPSPGVGAVVRIGGFRAVAGLDSLRFWRVQPTFILARVISRPQSARLSPNNAEFWIAVPVDDYRGFLGGPVSADGGHSVVGIVLAKDLDVTSQGRRYSVLAAETVSRGRQMETK